jgi:hypothetical protein
LLALGTAGHAEAPLSIYVSTDPRITVNVRRSWI